MKPFHPRGIGCRLALLLVVVFSSPWSHAAAAPGDKSPSPVWADFKTYRMHGLDVSLSKPVLVHRQKDFFWFPEIKRIGNGEFVIIVNTCEDWNPSTHTGAAVWSSDNGLTWSEPKPFSPLTASEFTTPSGDLLMLPYLLQPRSDGAMFAPYHVIPNGKREIDVVESGDEFRGFSYLLQPGDPPTTSFVVYGRTVRLKNGKYLVPLYGWDKDFSNQTLQCSNKDELCQGSTSQGSYKPKRTAIITAESSDGIHWEEGAKIADQDVSLPGEEGASETAICRLKDGRLMALFRMDSGLPYGQTWSSDEGKSWTTPVAASGPFSVAPSAVVMKNGSIVVAGGRPGLFLWFNTEGRGLDWQKIDPREVHNQCHPEDPIRDQSGHNTTSYAQVIALDDTHLLYTYDHTPYDRMPHGWYHAPKDPAGTHSVWVMRVTLKSTSH